MATQHTTLDGVSVSPEEAKKIRKNEKQGARIFRNVCSTCHTIVDDTAAADDGPKKQGPNLTGFFGQKAAQQQEYDYSTALKKTNITWDEDNLSEFLSNPKMFIRGTKMSFVGLKKEKDRKAIIAYLKKNCASPQREEI